MQAPGQITLAKGDILHDPGQHLQRPGDAPCRVPDQQEAKQGRAATEQQFQRRALHALGVELFLQAGDRCQQYVLGHADQHTPGRSTGNRWQRFKDVDLLRVFKHLRLTLAQGVHHLGIVHRLSEAADILAVGGDHATGADDADLAAAIE
ncbi:hypothetical protein D3C76_1054450 [compost metagenome]